MELENQKSLKKTMIKTFILLFIMFLSVLVISGGVSAADNNTTINTTSDLQLKSFTYDDYNYTQQGLVTCVSFNAINNGPNDATGVKVQLDIPEGVEIIDYNAKQGTYDPVTNIWTIGHISPSGSPYGISYLNIFIKSINSGTFTFTGTITGDQSDNNLANNINSTTIITPPFTDIQINQTVNNTSPIQNEQIKYTTTVTNNGPIDATNIKITNTIPTGLEFVSATGNYTYNSANKVITWTINSLANQASIELNFIAKVLATSGTQIDNIVKCNRINPPVSGGTQYDQDKTNNAACTSIIVNGGTLQIITDLQLKSFTYDDYNYTQQGLVTCVSFNAINNGPNDATGVKVQLDIPEGVEIIDYNAKQGTYDPVTNIWTIGHISPSGSPYGISYLNIFIKSINSGTFTFTGTITGDQSDNNLANNINSTTIITPPFTDIQINQTVNNTSPIQNEQIKYTTTVTNNGPIDATNIKITNTIPTGLEFVSATGNYTYNSANKVITWTINSLANQASIELNFIAKVLATSGTQIDNIVKCNRINPPVSGGTQYDQDKTNNAACTSILVNHIADIEVTQTSNNYSPNYLDEITLTITTKNNGPDNASGVETTITLPSGLEYVSHTTNKGTYDPFTGVWSIGSVGNQESYILTIIAKVVEACTIENTASKSAEVQYDPVESNNAQTVTLNIAEAAYVEVTKNVTPTNPNYHDTLTYTITATNQGPDDATGVNVNYSLPIGITLMGSSASKGSYTNGVWTIGNLANGETVTLILSGLINATGTITDNSLTTSQDQYKYNNTLPDPINFNIAQAAYVEVTKTATPTNPNYHDTVTYTITAANQGPDNATGVNINYTIPTGFTLTGTSATRGTYSNGVWTIGNLANGETVTLTLTALINKTGNITDNTLTTTQNQYKYNNTLPNPINFTIPLAADIQVTQNTPTTVNFGDQICVFFTATNKGPDTANNVVVNVSLPTGFFYSSHSGGSYDPTTGVWTVGSLLNGTYTTLNIIGTILTTNAFTINSTKIAETEYDYNMTNNNATNTVAINMGNVVSFTNVDDGSSSRITLPFAVYLFDRSYTTFYINVNGLVSFGSAMSTYIPDPSINQAFIAPFWDDIYMTGGAAAYYKVDGDVVTITWVKVPSYLERNNPTKFNTFQLRMVRDPSTGGTIYAFIYGDMQWKVGYTNGKSFAGFGGDKRNWWGYSHTYTTFWTQSGSLSQLANQTFWFNHNGVQIAAPEFVDPDIEVTQMASTDNPARRENFNITVTVTNLGPEPTTGVQITNELPSGLRFVSANTSKGSYDSSTGVWNIGNLEVNETVTLTLTVYAQQRGTYVIRSEKTSQVEYDPNPDNDFSEITVTVT